MATPVNAERIKKINADIKKFEQWAIKHYKDKSQYNKFVAEISTLKSSIDIIERTTEKGKLSWHEFKKDMQEHSDKIKKYFELLIPSLPFDWENMKKECKEVKIDSKKHKLILGCIIKIKTEHTAFRNAYGFYGQSFAAKNNPKEYYYLIATKKEVKNIIVQINHIKTYVLPYLKPVQSEQVSKNSTKKPIKLKISHNDYIWTPQIKGKITLGKQELPEFNLNKSTPTNKPIIPWNTEGVLTLNLSLGFSLEAITQENYLWKKNVEIPFSVDDKGVFKFGEMLSNTFSKTDLPIRSTLVNSVVQKIDEFKKTFKKKGELSIPNPKELANKVIDNVQNISPVIQIVKDQIKGYNFVADLIVIKKDHSIVIKADFKIGNIALNFSAAPLNLGASIDVNIPAYTNDDTIGAITFKVKERKKEVNKSNIEFDESQVKLDSVDKNILQKLIVEDFTSLIKTKLEKDFSKEKFSAEKIKLIRNLTLSESNKKFYIINIEGTTSCSGSEDTNRKVAKDRQNNVKKYWFSDNFCQKGKKG